MQPSAYPFISLIHAEVSMSLSRCSCVCFLLAILLFALPAGAQLVQVPDLSGFGNRNTRVPFSVVRPMRYQQIYFASAFPQGGIIDKIMFRNDEQLGANYGPTDIDLQIAFAYAATTGGPPSATFANNIGDNFTIVLDGVITESYSGPAGQTSFDFVLDVANTFD